MLNDSWAGRNPTKGYSADWRRTAELLDVLVHRSPAVVRNHAWVCICIVWIIVSESKYCRYGSDAKPWGYIRQIRVIISLYLSDKFYVLLIYSLVDRYKRFGATCCLHRSLVTLYRCTRHYVPKDSEFDATELPQIAIQSIVSQSCSVLHGVYENCGVFCHFFSWAVEIRCSRSIIDDEETVRSSGGRQCHVPEDLNR
jgi:hypothetical protein